MAGIVACHFILKKTEFFLHHPSYFDILMQKVWFLMFFHFSTVVITVNKHEYTNSYSQIPQLFPQVVARIDDVEIRQTE